MMTMTMMPNIHQQQHKLQSQLIIPLTGIDEMIEHSVEALREDENGLKEMIDRCRVLENSRNEDWPTEGGGKFKKHEQAQDGKNKKSQ
jgi:hypothetical protein